MSKSGTGRGRDFTDTTQHAGKVRRRKWPVVTHAREEDGWFLPGNQRPQPCYHHESRLLRLGETPRRTVSCGKVGVWKRESRELRGISTGFYCDDHAPHDDRALWGREGGCV